MHRLNELAAKLTPAMVKEVEDFAEFLIARGLPSPVAMGREHQPTYIDVDTLAGMCAGMGGDRTDVELAHEATQIRAAKSDL